MANAEERYAEALLMLSDTQADALNLLSDCYSDPDIKAFFNNPAFSPETKKDIIVKAMSSGFDPVLQNFVQLLIDKNRFSQISEIAKSYRSLVDQTKGVLCIKIDTAAPLTKPQIEALKEKFAADKAEVNVDPLLLGGIRVQVNDHVYDNTLKTMLTQMLGSELNER